jgi:hypothetical protein
MRFGRDRKYSRQEDGSFVPDDDPESTANVLRCSSQSFRYDLRHWEVVHITAGHDQSEEREAFTFRRDDAGSAYLRCLLVDDRRRFHVITESGITALEGPIELRLFPLSEGEIEIEGRLTHHPRWESSFDGEVTEERLSATLGIPADRFYWFLDRLRLPSARGVVSLDMRVYKEQIALSFDEPWMSQDFAVEHKSTSHITQYHLHVVEGPGIPEDGETEEYTAVGEEANGTALSPPVRQAAPVTDISVGQRVILTFAAMLLLLFAFSGATTYGSDQRLATFNFLAAVACLYLACRRSRT